VHRNESAYDVDARRIRQFSDIELLSVVVAHNETGGPFFERPGRREAAGGHNWQLHYENVICNKCLVPSLAM
jgi:hypothetical protein